MPTAQVRCGEREHADAEEGRPGAPTPAIEIGPSALTTALERRLAHPEECPAKSRRTAATILPLILQYLNSNCVSTSWPPKPWPRGASMP
jgi:hypothetical protein